MKRKIVIFVLVSFLLLHGCSYNSSLDTKMSLKEIRYSEEQPIEIKTIWEDFADSSCICKIISSKENGKITLNYSNLYTVTDLELKILKDDNTYESCLKTKSGKNSKFSRILNQEIFVDVYECKNEEYKLLYDKNKNYYTCGCNK